MKATILSMALLMCSLIGFAAEPARPARVQTGKMSTVHLLATARTSSAAVPDGMRFLIMVTPLPGTTGQFTLKETKDFLLDGQSYQEKTQAELGKRFEPQTALNGSAETFFAKQPGMRQLAPEDITGASILTIAIGGAPLTANTRGEITLNVGYGQQVEPFTFALVVPPAGSNSKAKKSAP